MFLPFLASDGCKIIRNGLSSSKKDLGQPLRNWQFCFCLDWFMSCLGVTAKLAVPKFAAAKKKNSGQTRFRGEAQANQR